MKNNGVKIDFGHKRSKKEKRNNENKNIQKEKGITLIALIITIIILAILAAVSIRAVTNNGIVGRAVNGAQDYAKAAVEENKMYDRIIGIMDLGIGKIYTETKTINGETASSLNPTIPKGFRPINTEGANWTSGGNGGPSKEAVNNGLVIEDKDGNQFVWIPCVIPGEGDTGTANADGVMYYKKDTTYNGTTSPNNKQGGYDGYTWADEPANSSDSSYANYEMTEASRKASVEKYGGFYIARYEAGIPSNAAFYANTQGGTYNRSRNIDTTSTLKPVSKAGEPSWNFISQRGALVASRNMYGTGGEEYGVTSNLVDSFAWDTIVNWMAADDSYKTGNNSIALDSSSHGNYYNSYNYNLKSNGLYVFHRYNAAKTDSGETTTWSYATTYNKGALDLGAATVTENNRTAYEFTDYNFTKFDYTIRKEIATGTLEAAKVKNIYDMAGNMWEWTTEEGLRNTSSAYAVLRGGSFYHLGSNSPVSYRHGLYGVGYADVTFGFRAVLYVNL